MFFSPFALPLQQLSAFLLIVAYFHICSTFAARNADGTISIASFSLFSINFNNNETKCLAVYNNVVAKKGDTSVGAITNNADGKVAVYDIMGRQLGTDINSMKGKLVIVKTANGTRKVLVK